MKTSDEFSDIGAVIILLVLILCAVVLAYEIGKRSIPNKELTIIERRNIAIQFMCFDYRKQWVGARSFCGSVAMDSKGMGK